MIPLVKPIFGAEEKKLVNEVIDSGIIASGKYVDDFEKKCAEFNGIKYAVATSNGTTALHAALLAAGIRRGDKVLTTPFSFIATSNSVLYCGAEPVFADIDPLTFNLSPEKCDEALMKDRSIKAIIVVHLYGMPCDMDAFLALKKKYNIVLIEDCAQAHGAMFKGEKVGSFGDVSAFSYYATKNVTTGEGGVVLTGSDKINNLARQIINHGRSEHSLHTILGYNYRLTNIAAAIGIVQLSHIKEWNIKRRKNAQFLDDNLKDLNFLKTPERFKDYEHVYHQYTVRVGKDIRQKFMEYLNSNGVGCGVYYPKAIYNQPLYRDMGFKQGLCPEAEKAAEEVLSIPVHPALDEEQLKQIVAVIQKFKN